MRVTDRMIFDSASVSSGRARDEVQAATNESSSGIKLTHPGDDPAAAGQLVSRQLSQSRFGAMVASADAASQSLRTADNAMQSVSDTLARARELAVQLSNDTADAGMRSAGAAEMKGLVQSMVSALNLRSGDKYLFGGFADDKPPYDANGVYQGDAGVRQLEVAPGLTTNVSVRADVAISGANGGVDILATLQGLATAMGTNDAAAIKGSLDNLDKGTTQLATARAAAGAAVGTLDAASSVARSAQGSEKNAIVGLQDADAISSATRLALAQRALEASISAATQSFKLTLLDSIR